MPVARVTATDIAADIDGLRRSQNQPPLRRSAQLDNTAAQRAQRIARGEPADDPTPTDRLVRAGLFARFGLSCHVVAPTVDEARRRLINDPLPAGTLSHGNLTHMGIGMARGRKGVVIAVDLAKLVDPVDAAAVRADLLQRIAQDRSRIGLPPLEVNADLDQAAAQVAADYLAGKGDSAALIDAALDRLEPKAMVLGKIAAALYVESDPSALTVPERTSAPETATVGLAVVQGNHPDHDPGSVVAVFFLGSPRAPSSARPANVPKPLAMPQGHDIDAHTSLVDQAWIATVAGNHKRAAALFESAFDKFKDPRLLYEAGRAHARNRDPQTAAATLERYAALVDGEERQRALDMAAALRAGKSIFTASLQERQSVEAKRFFILGQRLFSDGQWEGAIDAFTQAYTYAPHPDILYNIGLCHLRAGRIGDALDYFQEYQRQIPKAESVDQAKQMFQIGVELYAVGQYAAAAKRFALAYAMLPLPEILYNMGLCQMAMGEDTEALRIFTELADKVTGDQRREVKARIREIKKRRSAAGK